MDDELLGCKYDEGGNVGMVNDDGKFYHYTFASSTLKDKAESTVCNDLDFSGLGRVSQSCNDKNVYTRQSTSNGNNAN